MEMHGKMLHKLIRKQNFALDLFIEPSPVLFGIVWWRTGFPIPIGMRWTFYIGCFIIGLRIIIVRETK